MNLVQLVQKIRPFTEGEPTRHVDTMHYDCLICHAGNDNHHYRCAVCGTIPPQYSPIGKPARYTDTWEVIEVIVARGSERQESRRGRKVYFRTVPLDYFAS